MTDRRREDDRDERGSSRGRDRDDDRGSRGRERDEPRRGSRDEDDRGSRSSGRDRDRDDDRGGRSSGRSTYVYQQRSADEVKERASKGASDFDKILKPTVKIYKVKDGDNRVRIVPPTWKGAKHYGLDIWVHYGVGPDRGAYLDLQKMLDKPDPISEERDRARQESDPDEKYVKDLDSKRRVLVYLVDRDDEKEGVQAWAMPWTVDRDITKVSVDKDNGEVLPLDDPENGYDVTFEKKGKGDRTEYLAIGLARRSTPLGKAAWLDYAMDNPLPDQLQYYDYDHIAKAFGARGEQRDTARGRDDRDERGRDDRDDRDAPRGRGRDEREDRDQRSRDDRPRDDEGRNRDRGARDDDRGSSRRRSEDDEPTWESVHAMTRSELEDLVEQKDLAVKPREAKDDDDLADWICEEMKLTKAAPAASGRRRVVDADDEPADRLREMRRGRD